MNKAFAGLEFPEAPPRPLAEKTLATRLADLEHARSALASHVTGYREAICEHASPATRLPA